MVPISLQIRFVVITLHIRKLQKYVNCYVMLTTTFTGLVLQAYCNGGKEVKYANTEGSEVVDQRYDLKSINNSLEFQVNSLC
jgi:hypothetical protein